MSQDSYGDYYDILQVSLNADFETIERVFRMLAKRYHPDNTQTGDEHKFRALAEAYHVLSDPERRAAYDVMNERTRADRWKTFYQPLSPADDFEADLKLRQGILSILYRARRQNVLRPGVGVVTFENLLGCPRETVEFHLWYLKEKGFIQRIETGELAITAAGVDEMSRLPRIRRQLLTDGAANRGESDRPDGK